MLLALCACNRDGGEGSGDPPTDGSAEEDNTGEGIADATITVYAIIVTYTK